MDTTCHVAYPPFTTISVTEVLNTISYVYYVSEFAVVKQVVQLAMWHA